MDVFLDLLGRVDDVQVDAFELSLEVGAQAGPADVELGADVANSDLFPLPTLLMVFVVKTSAFASCSLFAQLSSSWV